MKSKNISVINEGKNVLSLEIEALQSLISHLDDTFSQAISIISKIKGRVIVTGMGKSGHIARKIASTFSSTGTNSCFVHPAEASHGDLGMIQQSDAVLALSNSGGTDELSNIIYYTRRFNIPLIAITKNQNSILGKAATLVLSIPKLKEACPMNLAPTSSTTMMIALGDALAISLLKYKGFSQEKFSILHPGGTLGQKLMHIQDIMHSEKKLPLASENTLMENVLIEMTAKSFGCVGVLNTQKNLIGVITDGDLRRNMKNNLLKMKAKDVMTKTPITIKKNALAVEGLNLMNVNKITTLFVIENDQPVGIVHIHDFLRIGIS